MTKASDNIFPKVTFVEGSAPSSPSASDFHLYFDSGDHLLKWKNSSGTVTTIATGSSGMSDPMTTRGDIIVRNSSNTTARLAVGATANMALRSDGTDVGYALLPGTIIATNNYAPGSPVALVQTSATLGDADATNMKVTFTTPASGNVIVRLSGTARIDQTGSGAGARAEWGIRESTTVVAGPTYVAFGEAALPSNLLVAKEINYYLTGLSAGSHTYKWAIGGGGGTNSGGVYVASDNPALMTVVAL